jgi:glutamate racemase
MSQTEGALGVFDSGVGGLTVVREILRCHPPEQIIYIGDTANVPYGSKTVEEIRGFSLGIARYLVESRQVRGIVIACNTATSAAAEVVRKAVTVPVVAMEPGVKPAVAATKTGIIGVLATEGTLFSKRFSDLVTQHALHCRVLTQPCPGWVEAVESGDIDSPQTRDLVRQYVQPLLDAGADTLVLGCTHYPILRPWIAEIAGSEVAILDTGAAVARRVQQVLPTPLVIQGNVLPHLELLSTGNPDRFERAVTSVLVATHCDVPVTLGHRYWKNGELYDDATS